MWEKKHTSQSVYNAFVQIGMVCLCAFLGASESDSSACLIPLRSVTWDRNNTTATGFQDVARALEQ